MGEKIGPVKLVYVGPENSVLYGDRPLKKGEEITVAPEEVDRYLAYGGGALFEKTAPSGIYEKEEE